MQKNRSRNPRGRANGAQLSSIGLAVLATLVAGGAQAADTTVSTIPAVALNTTAYQRVQSVQDKSQPVTATAAGSGQNRRENAL